jgi:hypothetical protein
MVEQNFPQYIHLDGRDFFYLTRRPLLPGRDLSALATPAEPGEGTWRTKGLPQHGFPYALATTTVRVPERPDIRLRVVRMDPHTIAAAGSVGTDEHTTALYFLGGASAFSIARSPPPDAIALAETRPFEGGSPPDAAAGIEDEEGMLVWIELPPNVAADESTWAAMKRILDALGCGTRVAVRARVLLGGSLDSAGDPAPPPTGTVTRLVRVAHPASRLYFDTPVVGPGTWQPLQMQRIRYFNRPKPSSDAGADSAAPTLGDAGTR